MNKVIWRWHDTTNTRVRYWKADWPDGVFHVIIISHWITIKFALKDLGWEVEEADD